MTTLNKTLRDQIIESVIKGTDLTARKEALKAATEKRVRHLCMQRVPEDFIAATRTMPAEWFPHETSVNVDRLLNPILLSTVSEDDLRKRWSSSVGFEPIKYPMNARFDRKDYRGKEDNRDSWEYLLSDLIEAAKNIRQDEEVARAELQRFLCSVKTYKQAIEKMPEIESHLPDYTKPMPLVVSVDPLRNTLGKLGFK